MIGLMYSMDHPVLTVVDIEPVPRIRSTDTNTTGEDVGADADQYRITFCNRYDIRYHLHTTKIDQVYRVPDGIISSTDTLPLEIGTQVKVDMFRLRIQRQRESEGGVRWSSNVPRQL